MQCCTVQSHLMSQVLQKKRVYIYMEAESKLAYSINANPSVGMYSSVDGEGGWTVTITKTS